MMDQSKHLMDNKQFLSGLTAVFDTFYADDTLVDHLTKSIQYSIQSGGKRIRPLFLLETLKAFGMTISEAHFRVAAAVELIHTSSLIHDDLPAMDNDDYRRGNLTNHKVFGEGLAILAGDGLLSYAFQLATMNEAATPKQMKRALYVLAKASGPEGMVGGQAFDLLSEGKHTPLEALRVLHSGKTGALFNASVELGLILGDADEDTYRSYMTYSHGLGLLFQITDDILDVTGTIEALGKTPGRDERQDKSTYVSLLGLAGAQKEAIRVAEEAKAALKETTHSTEILESLITYLIERNN